MKRLSPLHEPRCFKTNRQSCHQERNLILNIMQNTSTFQFCCRAETGDRTYITLVKLSICSPWGEFSFTFQRWQSFESFQAAQTNRTQQLTSGFIFSGPLRCRKIRVMRSINSKGSSDLKILMWCWAVSCGVLQQQGGLKAPNLTFDLLFASIVFSTTCKSITDNKFLKNV